MVTYKNITIKKKGGGTRKQRVQVLASGKYKFVKNLTKSVKSRSPKKTKTTRRKNKPKRRNRNLARRKNRGCGKSFTRTAYKLVRVGALAAPAVATAMAQASGHAKVRQGLRWYTGYDIDTGKFDFGDLAKGWMPFIGASLVTYGIPKITGLLRKL